jgi:protein ImuB
VYAEPLPAQVVDGEGHPVVVTGRGQVTAAPARLAIGGERWVDVVAWAGPWLVDERWWDALAHRRRARFHMVTTAGVAALLGVTNGHWGVEAIYD